MGIGRKGHSTASERRREKLFGAFILVRKKVGLRQPVGIIIGGFTRFQRHHLLAPEDGCPIHVLLHGIVHPPSQAHWEVLCWIRYGCLRWILVVYHDADIRLVR